MPGISARVICGGLLVFTQPLVPLLPAAGGGGGRGNSSRKGAVVGVLIAGGECWACAAAANAMLASMAALDLFITE